MTTPTVRLRPNVLAHPSPTTGRFLLLIGTLLSVGLLAGTLLHNGLLGSQWRDAALACFEQATAAVPIVVDSDDLIAQNDVLSACMAPTDRTRALVSLAGAVAIGLLGLVVVLAVPAMLRRRHRLRPAGPRLQGAVDRIVELSTHAGLRRAPRVMVGPAAQRDAFVFGLPGRYSIVLPTALIVRYKQAATFDPVVRHELAHIRRRDVPFAWLATGVWVAALPVLAAPLVVAAITWDFSLVPSYLWRAAAVMAVLWLVQRQALRSREHDADLHAARQAGEWGPLCSVLELNRSAPRWWRQFASHHPTVAHRIDILTDPGRVRGVSIIDALAAGFLTALLLPLVHSLILVAVSGTELVEWVPYISAALIGPITGLAVGVGLWRQALIDRVTGATTWPGGAVFGVVVGLLIGHLLGLDDLGLDESAGVPIPVIIIMGAAGVLLSAGTGRLWADAAARLPGGPRSWWIGFVVNALIFAVVLWTMQWIPAYYEAITILGSGPVDILVTVVPLATAMFYIAIVPLIVAVATMVWRRSRRSTPQWLVDGPAVEGSESARDPGLGWALLAGVVPGVIAAALVYSYRLIVGVATTDDDRIGRYAFWLIMGALTALVVSLVTLLAVPRSGAAVGLVTGAVTAGISALGIVAANTFLLGNILEFSFWWDTIIRTCTLWLAGYFLILPLALAVWPAPWKNVPGWLLALLTTVLGAGTAVVAWSVALALHQGP